MKPQSKSQSHSNPPNETSLDSWVEGISAEELLSSLTELRPRDEVPQTNAPKPTIRPGERKAIRLAPRTYPHTPAEIAKELSVDSDGNLWWRHSGNGPRKMNRPVGTITHKGSGREYKVTRLDSHLYKNVALAWCLYYGRWPLPGMAIDHINHDTLDDRKENLREVSNAENMRNRKGLQSNNRSGVCGVHYHTNQDVYVAQLKWNGQNYYGGKFKTFEEAVAKRRQMEIEFGVADHAIIDPEIDIEINPDITL